MYGSKYDGGIMRASASVDLDYMKSAIGFGEKSLSGLVPGFNYLHLPLLLFT